MSNIKRSIELTADSSGYDRTVQDMGTTLERAFEGAHKEIERLNGITSDLAENSKRNLQAIAMSSKEVYGQLVRDSSANADNMKEQLASIKRTLIESEKQLRIEVDRQKIAEQMRRDAKDAENDDALRRGDLLINQHKKKQKLISQEHQENMRNIRQEHALRLLQLRQLQQMNNQNINNNRAAEGSEEASGGGGAGGGAGSPNSAISRFGMSGIIRGNRLTLAAILTASGFLSKLIQEGIELDEAQSVTRGLGMKNIGSGSQYGMKRSDFLQYARLNSMAAGDATADAGRTLGFEKGFSQDISSSLGLTSALRTEGKGRDVQEVALEMLSIFNKSDLFNIGRDDFSQLAEKLEFNTRMLEQQGDQMFNTNATTNAQILRGMGNAGITDQRSMDYINSINSSITDPNNDFKKAFLFRALRKANPNASMVDLIAKQEQGIYGEGTLSTVMGDLRGNFSGDALRLSVARMFGLKQFQADKMLGMSSEDLAAIGSKEQLQNSIGMGDGKGGAGVVSRRMAQINDWFGTRGAKGVRKVDEYLTTFENEGFGGMMSKMGRDIVNAIKEGFDEVMNPDETERQKVKRKANEAAGNTDNPWIPNILEPLVDKITGEHASRKTIENSLIQDSDFGTPVGFTSVATGKRSSMFSVPSDRLVTNKATGEKVTMQFEDGVAVGLTVGQYKELIKAAQLEADGILEQKKTSKILKSNKVYSTEE